MYCILICIIKYLLMCLFAYHIGITITKNCYFYSQNIWSNNLIEAIKRPLVLHISLLSHSFFFSFLAHYRRPVCLYLTIDNLDGSYSRMRNAYYQSIFFIFMHSEMQLHAHPILYSNEMSLRFSFLAWFTN